MVPTHNAQAKEEREAISLELRRRCRDKFLDQVAPALRATAQSVVFRDALRVADDLRRGRATPREVRSLIKGAEESGALGWTAEEMTKRIAELGHDKL